MRAAGLKMHLVEKLFDLTPITYLTYNFQALLHLQLFQTK